MSFYEDRILPWGINLACTTKPITKQREKIVPHAAGRVLEIGFGSGTNLPFYDPAKVTHLWALEPSAGMRRKGQDAVDASPLDIEWLDLPGEEIPLEDNSADTVVLTFTLCTIPDWLSALHGMRRVLAPGGKLLFCEHGAAPDEAVKRWQDRINPIWKPLAGGCHLNRDIPNMIRRAGFSIDDLQTMYLPSTPKTHGFNYWGSATIR